MTTQLQIAWSEHSDLLTAAREAATRVQVALGGTPDAALVLSAGGEDEALPRAVRDAFGHIPLGGCHAMGLFTEKGLIVSGVAILALRSEELDVQTVVSSESGEHPWSASARAARLLLAGRPNRRRFPRGLGLLLGDPTLAEHWGPILKGWREFMGTRLKTIGAVTHGPVYSAATSYSRALSVFLMEGTVPIGVGVGQGWTALEHTFTVTKHDGCRVVELNGHPAAPVYLGAFPGHAPNDPDALARLIARHPLGLSGGEEHWLIRSVEGFDRKSLVMSTELPAGSVVRLMAGDPDSLKEAARGATKHALERLEGRTPQAAVMFVSAARYDLMRSLAVPEPEIIRDLIGREVPIIGCLSQAEVGPIVGTQPALHTGSVVVALFG